MTAENFDPCLSLVLGYEGGFVDNPKDPGGATNLGVTRATLARYRGRAVSVAEVRALTRGEAAAIYRRFYWDAVAGDRLPAGLDLAVFDCAVNSGPARAARLLQRALGVAEDGHIGPKTLAAVRPDVAPTIRACIAGRDKFLRGLPTWPTFGRGWSRRLAEVERQALSMASAPKKPVPPAAAPTTEPAAAASPRAPEGAAMTDVKSILSSRTVWANLIGFASLALACLA
jgi:lysozyme family protein